MPWNIETDEDESFWMITPARGSSFLDFGTIKVPKYADVRDVMNYIIQCANLMPEAVTLFGIVEEVLTLCATRAFDAETKHLMTHTAETVQTFKKKLEGGAEDERD